MSRFSIFLLLALAALAQALPRNNAQDAVKVVLQQQRVGSGLKTREEPLCEDCQAIITYIEDIIDNPTVDQKLISALQAICNLPIISKYQEQCLNLVNDVVVLLHELQSILDDPEKVCETIKFCRDDSTGFKLAAKRLVLAASAKFLQNVQKPAKEVDTCGQCTDAVDEVKIRLGDPAFVNAVTKAIVGACDAIFHRDDCKLFEKIVPLFIQGLLDHMCDSHTVCVFLQLCDDPAAMNSAVQKFHQLTSPLRHPHLSKLVTKISSLKTIRGLDLGCGICEKGVAAAIDILDTNKMLDLIDNDITSLVCGKILPKSLEPGCLDFMGIYFKAAEELTFDEWTPEQICDAVHLCSSKSFQEVVMPKSQESVLLCDVCKVLTQTLAYELQQPELQQEIIDVLTHACLLIPGNYGYKVRCQTLVTTYVPYILDDIFAVSLVPELCPVLHMCSSQ